MMIPTKEPSRPKSWRHFRQSIHYRWLTPLLFIDWLAEWAAYGLSKTSILDLLEYCGSFSILVGVIFYFLDAPERTKIKHYQAWQVVNTAAGKGGNGGRNDALRELNEDHIALTGVDLSDAALQGVQLEKADIRRGIFRGADLKDSNLSGSNLDQADMTFANLRDANLSRVILTTVHLGDADLNGALLRGVNLHGVTLARADLRGADLQDISDWKSMPDVRLANIHGVKNPPQGFVDWMESRGAVDVASDDEWNALLNPPAKTPYRKDEK